MSNFREWPLDQFPTTFHQIAKEGHGTIDLETVKWSPQSTRLRLHFFLHKMDPQTMWHIELEEDFLIITSRRRPCRGKG